MRCSTVTPGKFATFWRRPVSRLNRVDLPELGGPTIATMCRRVGIAGGGGRVATGQSWQSLIKSLHPKYFTDADRRISSPRGLAPQSDFRPVYAKHSRIATGRGMARRDRVAGEKAKFHQSPGVVLRQIQPIQDSRLPMLQFHEVSGVRVVFCVSTLLDSGLHLEPSIHLECCMSNSWSTAISIASCNWFESPSPLYTIPDRSGPVSTKLAYSGRQWRKFMGE